MSDEELDQEIRVVRPQRDFARLSVQLLEVSLQRAEGMITAGLQGFEEHVPEPGPNHNRFIGYYKYDKEAYVRAYEGLKPMRDLVRLINNFLPNMRNVRDNHQRRYQELIGQRELRQLRARMEADLQLRERNDNPEGVNDAVPNENDENGDAYEAPDNCNDNCGHC